MIRPILNARLDGASTIPATGTLTAATGSVVDLSLATVTLPASITSTFFDFKGNQSASGNPNYPAGSKGDVYYISVAGKVGGASGKTVTVGDMLICSVDNAGGTEASVGTSWFVTESNLDMTNVAITGGSITGITDITVADGGSGRSTGTTAYALIATGTTDTGAQQTLASAATTEILVGGGASALPVWTTATGTGAPVRATSPSLVTPVLGTPTSGTLTTCTGLPLTTGVTGTLPEANGGTAFTSIPKFHAYKTADQTTAGGSYEQITFTGGEEFDIGSAFASSAFTAPVAGKYLFACVLYCNTGSRIINVALYKNGTQIKRLAGSGGTRSGDIFSGSAIVSLAANDVMTIYSYTDSATTYTGAQSIAYFCGTLLPGG